MGKETAIIETSTLPPSRENPPRHVAIAVRLSIAGILLGVAVQLLLIFGGSLTQSRGVALFTAVATAALLFWFNVCLYYGKNWSRYVVLVLSVLGWLMFLLPAMRSQWSNLPVLAKISSVLNSAANLYLLWAIFTSSGRWWFKKTPVRHVA